MAKVMVSPLKCKDFRKSELKIQISKEFPIMPVIPIINNKIKAKKFKYDMTQTEVEFHITND